ncbi:MAG: hypothetical protein IPP69_17330 [Flavobacteriales bacterium]|nr:hypothetical protein [Flavobacteriales bacterium]
MFKWICIIVLLFPLGISAQWRGFAGSDYNVTPDTVWIISGKKVLDNNFQKQKLDFVIDARQTLISSQTARLGGLRLGVEYRRVHRFGIGVYGLGDGVHLKSLSEVDTSISEAVMNLSYVSMYYERVLYFHPKWEWSATIHMGKGNINGSYRRTSSDNWYTLASREVKPFEISTTGYYHLTWWCSLGVGVGYRYMRSTPVEVRPVYNAPVAIVRVRIKCGKLIKSIWNKNAKYEY